MGLWMKCLCFLVVIVPAMLVFIGPIAKQHGADRATLVIEASACGDSTGIVAEGWEERCADRAASMSRSAVDDN